MEQINRNSDGWLKAEHARKTISKNLSNISDGATIAALAVRAGLLAVPGISDALLNNSYWVWGVFRDEYLLNLMWALQAAHGSIFFKIEPAYHLSNAVHIAKAAANMADMSSTQEELSRLIDAGALDAAALGRWAKDPVMVKTKVGFSAMAIAIAAEAADISLAGASAKKIIDRATEAIVFSAIANPNCLQYLINETGATPNARTANQLLVSPIAGVPGYADELDRLCGLLELIGSRFHFWSNWLNSCRLGTEYATNNVKEILCIPPEIWKKAPVTINSYIGQLRNEECRWPLNKVRAIFIGYGEAGKTSLIRRLNGKDIVEGKEPMTPGVDVTEWQIPSSDIKALFWDFGGQVMAHATHQFFLRSRCVYVLLLNARTDINANQQAEYWLEHVRAFGEDAPVLLVGNKSDLAQVNLDLHRLTKSYSNIRGFL